MSKNSRIFSSCFTKGIGIVRMARSTATSNTESAKKIVKASPHSSFRARSVWNHALNLVPQAESIKMINVIAQTTTTPITTQFVILKARPRNMRRYKNKRDSFMVASARVWMSVKGTSSCEK